MTQLSRLIDKILYINWGHGTDADTTPYNDVSDDVLQGTLKVIWGRDQSRSTSPSRVESLEAVLQNQDGTYNNASGPLAGFVNRGPDIAAYLTHTSEVTVDSLDVTVEDETWTLDDPEQLTLFRGFIEQAPQSIDSIRSVSISALGILHQFVHRKVTIPLMENTRVDLILHAICDQLGISSDIRVFDIGDVTIDRFWMADEPALPILPKLLATEGPNSAIFTNNLAELHFQGNQYRLNNYRSNTVQWYVYDSLVSTAPFRNPVLHNPVTQFNQNPDEVYNRVSATVNAREVDAVVGQKWNYGAAINLGASQAVTVYAQMQNPVQEAVTPVAGTDYQLQSGTLASIVLSATSGSRIGITITAGVGGAVIIGPVGQESDGLFLRAKEISVTASPQIVSTVDTSSYGRYGDQPLDLDLWPEINPNIAQDIVNAIARRYKEPRDQLTIQIKSRTVDEALFILRSQISDRIHISVAAQGVDADYYIESKTVQVLGNGLAVCFLGCEEVIDESAFRFGIDRFGQNVFG